MTAGSVTGSETRCEWATASDAMLRYHDHEWGVPLHDDVRLFEYLTLDGFQAGLSWSIILRKREAFRQAFHGFRPDRVATMDQAEVSALLQNPEIVRNRAKIAATIGNAQAFLDVQAQFGSFDAYMWSFVGSSAIQNVWESWKEVPAETGESRALSRDLRNRGFRFVGPTIVYAVMQSAGLVNDHLVGCFRHAQIRAATA